MLRFTQTNPSIIQNIFFFVFDIPYLNINIGTFWNDNNYYRLRKLNISKYFIGINIIIFVSKYHKNIQCDLAHIEINACSNIQECYLNCHL